MNPAFLPARQIRNVRANLKSDFDRETLSFAIAIFGDSLGKH
jgi:hypothetical protein